MGFNNFLVLLEISKWSFKGELNANFHLQPGSFLDKWAVKNRIFLNML